MTPHHAEILEARGLDVELLVSLGVESFPQRGGEWIRIPYRHAGRVVNHKYRTIAGQKKFYQDADAEKCFWNVDVIADPTLEDQPLVICEGEFDAAIAIQAGYVRAVSVPDGAPKQAIGDEDGAKYTFVTAVLDQLKRVPVVILAADGDGPGINLMNDLALRIGRARCKYLRYPDGCKDLNDVWRLGGAEAVRALIDTAEWLRVDGYYRMSELPPLVEPDAAPLGSPIIDRHIRIRRSDFQVVTGIPNMGKSTWINEMACRLAHRHGWRTGFFSPEQRAQTDHRRALRHWFLGKPPKTATADDVATADAWIDRHFFFLLPDEEKDEDATLDWVLDIAATAVIRTGIEMLVIDPWNELDHAKRFDMSLTEYTGQAIKRFKRFAKRFDVHLCVAAHPTKLQRDKRTNDLPVPTLYDIADSAHWYNKPDLGVVVHRYTDRTLVRVEKVRYAGINGLRGDLFVEFDRYQGRFRVREDLMTSQSDLDDSVGAELALEGV